MMSMADARVLLHMDERMSQSERRFIKVDGIFLQSGRAYAVCLFLIGRMQSFDLRTCCMQSSRRVQVCSIRDKQLYIRRSRVNDRHDDARQTTDVEHDGIDSAVDAYFSTAPDSWLRMSVERSCRARSCRCVCYIYRLCTVYVLVACSVYLF